MAFFATKFQQNWTLVEDRDLSIIMEGTPAQNKLIYFGRIVFEN